MTTEQKAKAYDKAVKEASIAYKDEDKHLKATLERIFPELKESEDEQIRKRIIHFLHGDVLDMEETNKALAWLEKQGEQKPYSWKPNKEQFEALDYAYNSCPDTERGNYYEGVLETLIEDLHRLEKQSERKPTWTEEDEKRLNSCLIILQPKTLVGNTETMNTKWLKSLKERIGG